MGLIDSIKLLWNLLRDLWRHYLTWQQKKEQAIQDRVSELTVEYQTAVDQLEEKEKSIDQSTEVRLSATDPDTVVADLNDFFRGVRPGQSGGD